jgi:NAD(P)H-hydrate epimerase
MLGITGAELSDNSEDPALKFSSENNCVVVLKSYKTLVAVPDGRLFTFEEPNSGLSKGGSGDVLAGLTAGLLAQGMEPYKAACSAVFIHSKAGRAAAGDIGERCILPTDILNYLPEGYQEAGWSDDND